MIISPDPLEALFVSVMLRVADSLHQAFPLSSGVLVQRDMKELHFGSWTDTTKVSRREEMPSNMAGEGCNTYCFYPYLTLIISNMSNLCCGHRA